MKILLVEALGLPAAFLGCYGNDWVATPTLDRLAWEGVVFDRHILDRPAVNLDDAGGLVLGRYPPDNSEASGGTLQDLLARSTHFRKLRIPNLEALAVTAAAALHQFDTIWVEGPVLFPPWKLPAEMLGSYFDAEDDLPPWAAPPAIPGELSIDDQDRLQRTFAAVVTAFDAQLEQLVGAWESAGDGLLIVTSRCGLPLGEHDLVGVEGSRLHEELVHAPLIVRFGDRRAAGLRVLGPTQPVDLARSILEWAGLEVPGHFQGRSMVPLTEESEEGIRPAAVSMIRRGEEEEWALRTPEWAYLETLQFPGKEPLHPPALFRKPEDLWEVNDVYQQNLDMADILAATLRRLPKLLQRDGSPGDADWESPPAVPEAEAT